MNTITYDSRSYNPYQFWGNLIDGAGFSEFDYPDLTVTEQVEIATRDILAQRLRIVDFDGEEASPILIKHYVKMVLEKRNS